MKADSRDSGAFCIGAASAILINLRDVPFRATLVRKWFTEVDDRKQLPARAEVFNRARFEPTTRGRGEI